MFVPVDSQQNMVGGKYYIPEQLFNQLLRQAAIASGQPNGYLITRAVYQGALSRDPGTKQLGLTKLKVSLDLRVFQSNVSIALPFPREAAANPIVGARLEGKTIPVEWNAAGDELNLGRLAAERYRLELDLQPPLQTNVTAASFDLAITPLANASLELAIPADAPAIELPTAEGQIRIQKDRGLLLAQLGACNRLAVRWPVGIGMEAAAANLEVEELIWVRVRPGATVLDARFKYRVLEGRVRQIRLLTDPRLRLLPSVTAQPLFTAHTIPGDPQKIDLELSRAVSDQVVIDLSFLLTGTSGVGNLQLPRLESTGARATKRLLAASIDPALQYKELPGEDSKPMAVADFMAAWGAVEARPQAAYSIPRGEAMWVLATQPGEPHTTVEQSLAVSLGRGSALVQFEAALTVAGGYLFQLGMKGPTGLAVERVSVLEDDVERVARWSVDEDGRITVFLTTPITGKQVLKMRGRVDLTRPDATAVPKLDFAGGQIKRKEWRLYRQAAVLVEVDKNPRVAAVDPPNAATPDGFGALLGCYQSDDAQANIKATITPNVSESRAVMVTTLERDADRWMAELACHVEVTEGLVDALQFEIPPQWLEPFRVDPPTPFKIVPVPGEARRQLMVYPQRPIQDKYQLKIRGRVVPASSDRLRVPDILLQRTQQVERYVVLPERLDLQQVSWETVGLSRAQLPAEFVAPGHATPSPHVYQVASERFQASLKGVQRAAAEAQVGLADFHVVWQPDGNCQGVATFDLEPRGATHCVLELPSHCQLVHVSVENLSAQITPLAANRWRLSLGPPELPERVEVIYSGPLSGSPSRRHFEAPRLVDLAVAQTLWTIYGPPQFAPGQTRQSGQAVSAARQEVVRLKNVAALMQLPAEITGEHLPEEIARWYRPWKQRYAASRAALDGELTAAGASGAAFEEASQAHDLDQKVAAVDARLGAPITATRQASWADAASEFLATSHAARVPVRYMASGPLYGIELDYRSAASTSWGARWVAGLALLALGAAAAVVLRGRPLPQVAPWLVVGCVGFAWWLFLAPSAVGFLMLLIAGWIGLGGRRQGQPRLSAR